MNRQPNSRSGRAKNPVRAFDDPEEMLEVQTYALEEALDHAIRDLGGAAVCHLGRAYCPATDLSKWLMTLPLAQRVARRFVLGFGYMSDTPNGEATAPFVRVDRIPDYIAVRPVSVARVRRAELRVQGLFIPLWYCQSKVAHENMVLARPVTLDAQGLEFDPSPRRK